MGSRHVDGSQGKLHGLFNSFPKLVANKLAASIRHVLDDRGSDCPVRILDIGAGQVPYRDAFSELPPLQNDLVFIDQDNTLPGEHRRHLPDYCRWITNDFFSFWPSFLFPNNDDQQKAVDKALGGRFNIVLCAASVHELYFDAVTRFGQPIDFHRRLFQYVREHLLDPNGLFVMADYAWPSSVRTSDVWKIREVQLAVANHADPPWAFLSVSDFQESAVLAGLRLIESSGQGLHDELTDAELSNRYEDRLTPDQLQTLRTRFGFVKVFSAAKTPIDPANVKAKGQPSEARPRVASRYLSLRAEEVFSSPDSDVGSGLQSLFTSRSDDLAGTAPLCHLVDGLRRRIETLNPTFEISRGVLEAWVNLGLKGHSAGERIRFVPKLLIQWSVNAPGAEVEAGVLSTSLLKQSKDEMGRLFAGRIAIPYRSLKDQPTLHQWFAELHRKMRNLQPYSFGSTDNRYVRSLTIVAQDKATPNAETTAMSLSFASSWGNEETQAESGHYLVILPAFEDKRHFSTTNNLFVDHINHCLARIVTNVLGAEVQMRSLPPGYEPFLDSVFYRLPVIDSLTDWIDESNFDSWWNKNSEQSSPDRNDKFPDYRAYSTIALGCDGLSTDDPDTLMIFATQAIRPDTLQTASEDLATACRRLSSLESEVLIRSEATAKAELQERNLQHRAMVASFGHDGKRPASTIELLLRSGSQLAVQLAKMLSRSLVLRLEAFSSLLNAPASIVEARTRLQRENERAQSWITLRAIWEEESLNLLLRILVDDSGFAVIRERLFGKDATIDCFDSQFEDLVAVLSTESTFDSEERVGAVRATLRKFAALQPGFTVSYSGMELRVPYALSGEGGDIRVPLAVTSLSFLIAEMLTNNAKHQWPSLKPKLKEDGIHLRLLLTETGDDVDLDFLSKPAMSSSPRTNLRGDEKTITGLMSLRMVAAGIGVTPGCKEIRVNGDAKGEFPFSENSDPEKNGEVWSTYSLKGFRQFQRMGAG